MNESLWFLYDSLETEVEMNRLIFNSGMDSSIEKRIERQYTNKKISLEEQRLLVYFFKTQAACKRLLSAAFNGLELESERLLKSTKSIAWKKEELNHSAKLLRSVLFRLKVIGKMDDKANSAFEKISIKIQVTGEKQLEQYAKNVESFKFAATKKIDSREMLTEMDWVKEWSAMQKQSPDLLKNLSAEIDLTVDEVLFYHLYVLFNNVYKLSELFTRRFRNEFHFSMNNIVKGLPIEIVSKQVELSDEKVNSELHEILKKHVSKKSIKLLKAFFTGKTVDRKIEFLGEKGELIDIFRLLYRNDLITTKPKLIATLIANSFTLPNCSDGPELNPERVREAICRKKNSPIFLSEIRKMAHRKRWKL